MSRITIPVQKKAAKVGRPTLYSAALVAEICRMVMEGESIRTICAKPDMPSWPALGDWLRDRVDFASQYARAREAQADMHVEEMLDVARTTSASLVEHNDKRLLVDTLKWRASKMKPKVYGDKFIVDATVGVQQMSDEEIRARLTELLTQKT